jgi:threonine/homoserine/homoserine lactone efflux protein
MIDPLLFALATLTLLVAPGPTNTLLAASGAAIGVVRSLPLLAAVVAAYLIAIVMIRLVLGPVVAAAPQVAIALKVAVALYLGWIAIRMWMRAGVATAAAVGVWQMFVATLLNPKSLIFAIGILPADSAGIGWYVAGFCAAVVATGTLWTVIGHGVGLATRQGDARLVPRIAAVALGGFAGVILASALG